MQALSILGEKSGSANAIGAILEPRGISTCLIDLSRRCLVTAEELVAGTLNNQHATVQEFYYQKTLETQDRGDLHKKAAAFYENEPEEQDILKAARHYARAEEFTYATQLATANYVWDYP